MRVESATITLSRTMMARHVWHSHITLSRPGDFRRIQDLNVFGLESSVCSDYIELNSLILFEGTVAGTPDVTVMNENIAAVGLLNNPESPVGVEPLHSPLLSRTARGKSGICASCGQGNQFQREALSPTGFVGAELGCGKGFVDDFGCLNEMAKSRVLFPEYVLKLDTKVMNPPLIIWVRQVGADNA